MAAADGDGNTALILAARCGHEAVAKLLLDHGADVAAADNHGNTALIFAAGRGHGAVAKLLLVHGADVAAAQNAGVTALIGAVFYGHEAVAELLLDHRADMAAAQNSGGTALMDAARGGHGAVQSCYWTIVQTWQLLKTVVALHWWMLLGVATGQWQSCCWTIVQTWQLLTAMVTLHWSLLLGFAAAFHNHDDLILRPNLLGQNGIVYCSLADSSHGQGSGPLDGCHMDGCTSHVRECDLHLTGLGLQRASKHKTVQNLSHQDDPHAAIRSWLQSLIDWLSSPCRNGRLGAPCAHKLCILLHNFPTQLFLFDFLPALGLCVSHLLDLPLWIVVAPAAFDEEQSALEQVGLEKSWLWEC